MHCLLLAPQALGGRCKQEPRLWEEGAKNPCCHHGQDALRFLFLSLSFVEASSGSYNRRVSEGHSLERAGSPGCIWLL